jgi:hypothetical protein
VVDLSAGPCTYGKIETEEGSVSARTLPRLQHVMLPRGVGPASGQSSHDIFVGQLASLISTTVEHVIAPDVRYLFYFLMWRMSFSSNGTSSLCSKVEGEVVGSSPTGCMGKLPIIIIKK